MKKNWKSTRYFFFNLAKYLLLHFISAVLVVAAVVTGVFLFFSVTIVVTISLAKANFEDRDHQSAYVFSSQFYSSSTSQAKDVSESAAVESDGNDKSSTMSLLDPDINSPDMDNSSIVPTVSFGNGN